MKASSKNRKIKVLYVVPDLSKKGGIQQLAKAIGLNLGQEYDVSFADWSSPLNLFQEGVLRFVPSFIAEKLFNSWFHSDKSHVSNLQEYDLIHYWNIKAAMSQAVESNKPYVVTCHGLEILKKKNYRFQRSAFFSTLNNAAAITAVSRFTKDYLVNEYAIPDDVVQIINPCIDISEFRSRSPHSTNEVTIGTISRFVKRKNILNTIKALEILSLNDEYTFVYHLAGDGPLKQKILKKLHEVSFDWKYFGEISEEEKLSTFYPNLDLFVLPPLALPKDIEGFGIVFLEANACGIPVVAANTGGVSDAVQPGLTGLFADPLDPKDIADKISTIINTRAKFQKHTRQWAESFDKKLCAHKYAEFYRLAYNGKAYEK